MKSRDSLYFLALLIYAMLPFTLMFGFSQEIHSAQVVKKTIFYDGVERTYWEHVPETYNGLCPVPLVIMLHGGGGNGVAAHTMSGWSTLADQENFIVVYPDGGLWNDYNWSGQPDDVGFLKALIDKLKVEYIIDEKRIYTTGHSMGAGMTLTFAFKYTDVLAAIAPVSGPWITDDRMFNLNPLSVPQPTAPIPVYLWRGEKETWPSLSEERLRIQYWTSWNHCNVSAQVYDEGIYRTEVYGDGRAEVRYTEIKDRGHGTYDFKTAAKIWYDFFSQLTRETVHS